MPFLIASRHCRARSCHVLSACFLLGIASGPASVARAGQAVSEAPVLPGHFYLDPQPGTAFTPAMLQTLLDHELPELDLEAVRPVGQTVPAEMWSHGVDLSRLVRLEFATDGNTDFGPEAATDLARRLARLPGMKRCEPVYLRPASAWYPDDPGLTAQWHLKAVEATGAWQIRQGQAAVKVAILDTGVDMDHEDLQARLFINPGEDLNGNGVADPEDEDGLDSDDNGLIDDLRGWDYVDLPPGSLWPGEDGAPADPDPDDFNGHGTHCAGIAGAAGNNGLGVAGLGFGSTIVPIRIGFQAPDGQGYVGYSVEGLMLAAAYHCDVVSMSYGSTGFSAVEQEMFFMLAQSGMICVGAAGNENSTETFYPAGYPQVIAVAATRQGDSRASYSNHGSWIDVAAPGSQILATTVGGGYGRLTGTSMACPLTAGLCGLLKGIHPEWGLSQLLARIQATCDPVTSDAPTMGAGRINARRALDLVPRVSAVTVSDNGRRLRSGVEETVEFTVTVPGENPLADAVIHLSSPDPDLELPAQPVAVGMLFPQQQVTVPGLMSYTGSQVGTIRLDMALVDGDTLWTGQALLGTGQAGILLIDADRSSNWDVSPYLEHAFGELGEPLETFSYRLPTGPLPDLARFEHIVLISGSDLEPELEGDPVSADFMDTLVAYADNGGHLLLSGQNLADALPATVLEDRIGATVSGPAIGRHRLGGR
jgi:subtilisin family serine protease